MPQGVEWSAQYYPQAVVFDDPVVQSTIQGHCYYPDAFIYNEPQGVQPPTNYYPQPFLYDSVYCGDQPPQ